jgi:hypothetical protein
MSEYTKVSRLMLHRQKRKSLIYNEVLLYENLIQDYFYDRAKEKNKHKQSEV